MPADSGDGDSSLRGELGALKHPRLWLVYLAIALVQGGMMAAYSYVAPLLTERAGLATAVVPLAMLGYGVGALAGISFGGRLGDGQPYATLIPATAVTAAVLAAITLWATNSAMAVILVVLLGAAGISTNPILVGEVVRIAGPGRALSMALATSAFQVGGGWLSGRRRKDADTPTPSPARQRLADRFDVSLPVNQRKLDATDALAHMAEDAGMTLIEMAIAFALNHPAVTSVIIGPRTLDHLESQLPAADVVLPPVVLNRIDEIVTPGTVINPADSSFVNPALQPAARRR
ncbi:aldo/keto reductase [Microbispora sitophila]|uniref:aldo/keto reductase n=1 Tax=Microbispora sitophila TaxID=2771537 RepID=UPI001D0122AB|nr:aldo/keto reductase [Microbispora sitophila]